jgi:hypothetical protein
MVDGERILVDCALCKKAVEHSEVFYDEEKDNFICLICQEERIKRLMEATPDMLLRLIRLCHPCEKGEPYKRWEVIDEIRKRGVILLSQLGWPDKDDSIYKNRYTGHEETLKEMYSKCAQELWRTLIHDLPFVMEHWSPKEIWTDEDVFNEYKRSPKLTSFFK